MIKITVQRENATMTRIFKDTNYRETGDTNVTHVTRTDAAPSEAVRRSLRRH